ncbi:exonuclease domain-containing protein [Zhongshania aliphaticivorans]|uniref:exonuclease domain-containing protein n=1 Tax=Zhongshania aliphaticivorans TaxID=1470434 RepID=UPI0012E60F5B|nr:exonuclease domain-containing protein [Zhongshania aliphaticivorans]CAA0120448.1 DNA polymerase III PolC-type [Zhongshania aliphaticivorans]
MKFGMRSLRRPQRDIDLINVTSNRTHMRLLESLSGNKHLINWPISLCAPIGDELTMYIVDSETNGVHVDVCDIIELGALKVRYSPSAQRLTSIDDMLSCYEAPFKPLSDDVVEITGISNEMLTGRMFNNEEVAQWFAEPGAILVNSKKHEQAFIEKRFPALCEREWLCLQEDIPWTNFGYRRISLSALLAEYGWHLSHMFTYMDCFAIVFLLISQHRAFESLCEALYQEHQSQIEDSI